MPKRKYGKIVPPTFSKQEGSYLLKVRKLNNYIKSNLLQQYLLKDRFVCDLGCGKGGDFLKFIHCNIKMYVGIDKNIEFIDEAKNRIKNYKNDKHSIDNKINGILDQFSFCDSADFTDYDQVHQVLDRLLNSNESSKTILLKAKKFHLVTAFFSIHTIFECEFKVDQFCKVVDSILDDSLESVFICTFMDGVQILKWMKNINIKCIENGQEFKFELVPDENRKANKIDTDKIDNKLIKIDQSVLKSDLTIPNSVEYGIPIQVEMNASTVPKHIEYLTSIDLLMENFLRYNIILQKSEIFQAQGTSNLPSVYQNLFSCSRYAIFKRKE